MTSAARQYGHAEPPQDPKLKVARVGGGIEVARAAAAQDDIKALGRKMVALQAGHDALASQVAELVKRITELSAAVPLAPAPPPGGKIVDARKRTQRG